MALIISNTSDDSSGSQKIVRGQIAFDASYPTGGEVLTAATLGLAQMNRLKIQPEQGYLFDSIINSGLTQANIIVRRGGSTETTFQSGLVVEQIVAVAANTGTLPSAAGYVISVDVTTGGATGPKKIIPSDQTPAAGQVGCTPAGTTLIFAGADAVTQCRVTYVPYDTRTQFNPTNVVIDETVVAAAAGVNLANRAAMIQYVYDDTNGAPMVIIPVGEAPSAGEVAIDINNAGNTTLTTNAADDGNNLIISYFRYSGLYSPDQFIDDADITLNSEAYNWTSDGGYCFSVLPGFGTVLVGETGAAGNIEALWGGPSVTAANNVARFRPAVNDILTDQTVAAVTMAMPFTIWPSILRIPQDIPSSIAAEIANGTNLSALSAVEFEAYGH